MTMPGADNIVPRVREFERSLDFATRINWDRYGWIDRPDARVGDA